jgi:hypothetical protein
MGNLATSPIFVSTSLLGLVCQELIFVSKSQMSEGKQ